MILFPTAALTDLNLWALGGIGLVAGMLGSMLGVGGGIIIVPLLTLVLRLPIHVAIGSSLVAIVATSCTATCLYAKDRLTNLRLALLLCTTTTPGAIVGGLIAAIIVAPVLNVLFGLVLAYVAYTMMTRRSLIAEEVTSEEISVQPPDGNAGGLSRSLAGSFYDRHLSQTVSYKVNCIREGLGASFFSGVLSSLLGIGGGIINVPVMHLVMGMPMKATIATSSFVIAITTAVGALIYYYYGLLQPVVLAPLVIAVMLGARLGSELTQRAAGALLRRIFGILLLITAALMFLKVAGVI